MQQEFGFVLTQFPALYVQFRASLVYPIPSRPSLSACKLPAWPPLRCPSLVPRNWLRSALFLACSCRHVGLPCPFPSWDKIPILSFVEFLMTRWKFCSTPWPCVSAGISSLRSLSWQPPQLTAHRPIIMWHSPPPIRHTRLRVRRPGIESALHA